MGYKNKGIKAHTFSYIHIIIYGYIIQIYPSRNTLHQWIYTCYVLFCYALLGIQTENEHTRYHQGTASPSVYLHDLGWSLWISAMVWLPAGHWVDPSICFPLTAIMTSLWYARTNRHTRNTRLSANRCLISHCAEAASLTPKSACNHLSQHCNRTVVVIKSSETIISSYRCVSDYEVSAN